MSSKKSEVWKYFTKKEKSESVCNICKSIIQRPGSNTTGMINHLKLHSISLQKRNLGDTNETDASSSKNTKSVGNGIINFISRESLNEILAKCATKDGFSIKGITSSEAIRGFVASRNYKMPKSETTVMKYIMDFYKEKKEELMASLLEQKKSGERFSITVDEWSDINVRRFMNITLHSATKPPVVLGLSAIIGSCDSNATIDLVKAKLKDYGIEMDNDIVGSTHDGASVMVKYGKNILPFSQLCYNHAIHLAVLDVFYKKSGSLITNDDAVIDTNFQDDENLEYDENLADDDCVETTEQNDEVADAFAFDGNLNFQNDLVRQLPIFREDIGKILDETRKIIKFFKYSSVRSSVLEKHIIDQEGKKLRLLLDCKTRWNSIIPMVNRFIKIYDCIQKALMELGQQKCSQKNIKVLEEISHVLQPVELAVKELSKDNNNLLKAEGVCIFLLNKLKETNTQLAMEMFTALKKRIEERRNEDVVSLLRFLQSGNYPKPEITCHFTYLKKSSIHLLAKETFKRLFNEDPANTQMDTELTIENEEIISNNGLVSNYDELQKTIELIMTVPKENNERKSTLEKEMKLWEKDCSKRGDSIGKLFTALLTIQPTSTVSERVFSVASAFVTKTRNQLKMETVDKLVFLKYYFLNKK